MTRKYFPQKTIIKRPHSNSNLDRVMFRDGLVQGDKNVIHPVLAWILPKIPELRKRAYLAKYLLNFEVPSDMINDEVYAEFKQRQSDFRETHKILEGIRSSEFQPSEFKAQVNLLDEQKMKLVEQLERVKKKFDKQVSCFVSIMYCSSQETDRF